MKLILSFFLSVLILPAFSQEIVHPELAQKLEEVFNEDQKYRLMVREIADKYGFKSTEMAEHWELIAEKDAQNVKYVTSVLDSLGWLGKEQVGTKGSQALFLVIQHASPETQAKYIPLMREAVRKGKASAGTLAMLKDRLALSQGKLQIYGT
jgi:hypothetical protein